MVIDLLAEYLDFQVLNDEAISTLKRKATRENPIPFKTQKNLSPVSQREAQSSHPCDEKNQITAATEENLD
jgi:hypothetical protein